MTSKRKRDMPAIEEIVEHSMWPEEWRQKQIEYAQELIQRGRVRDRDNPYEPPAWVKFTAFLRKGFVVFLGVGFMLSVVAFGHWARRLDTNLNRITNPDYFITETAPDAQSTRRPYPTPDAQNRIIITPTPIPDQPTAIPSLLQ